MKKTVFLSFLVMVSCLTTIWAQDTLRNLPGNYITNQWTSLEGPDKYSCPVGWGDWGDWFWFCDFDSISQGPDINNGNHIIGNQLITDHPIKIVGIAACAYMQGVGDTTIQYFMNWWSTDAGQQRPEYFFPNVRDTSVLNRITDSMILYKPVGNSLVKLISAPWRMEQPHASVVLPPEVSPESPEWPNPIQHNCYYNKYGHPHYFDTAPVSALYEVYFDKPIVVEDSFVVAGTAFNNDGSYGMECPPIWDGTGYQEGMWLWDHRATRYWFLLSREILNGTPPPFYDFMCWRKFRDQPWARIFVLQGHRANRTQLFRWPPMIYPIIDLYFDTIIEHCQQVVGVRVAESTDSTATLMWDAVNSVRWEVKYGMVGMDEANYRVVTTSSPTVTLTGLRPEVQYKAYVRGWCPCDSSWGAWSAPKTFRVEPSQPIGIDQPSDLDRYTHLIPNPAHGRVSVVSSLRLERVVIYDLDGRRVAEQEATGISAVVDISHLASGTYIAALHTPNGIATKKLVVR